MGKITQNYCTLFDSNYLARGIAMYYSLLDKCPDFHLYIFSFDNISYEVLTKLNLQKASIISLYEFENDKLLAIKSGRTKGEYCWTCTSSTIKYCLEAFNLAQCTYVDADMIFYSNPNLLIEEMGEKSILLTEHRYTPRYNSAIASGIYCVQFVSFKADDNGLEALNWWTNACIEWCYNRYEDGKFGDQKYLDDWTTRFEGVYVLKNLGGGVAPWNIQQYELSLSSHEYYITETKSKQKHNLVFYHFHYVRFIGNSIGEFGTYKLSKNIIDLLYKPYINQLISIEKSLIQKFGKYNYNGRQTFPGFFTLLIKKIKLKRYRSDHIYNLKTYKKWLI